MDNMPILDEWLSSILKEGTKAHHQRGMRYFAEFMATSPERILEIRKSEPRFETKVVQFYQWMIKTKELSPNSARSNVIAVQSFFKYVKEPIDVRNKLPDITMKVDDYQLSLSDLQSMFRYGDPTIKTAINVLRDIPARISDILQLLKTEPKTEQTLVSKKEGVPGKIYLTEECLSLLSKWRESLPTTTDGWNKMLSVASKNASINGKVTCHSFRKLWLTTAVNLGLQTEIIKILTFKKVPKDLLTYMLNRSDLRSSWEKVINALPLEPKNGNGRVTRIEESIDLVSKAIAKMITEQLKKDGVLSAIVEQDPMDIIRNYVVFQEAIPPQTQEKKKEPKSQRSEE